MGISRKYYPASWPSVSVTGSAAIFALSAFSWNIFVSSRLYLMEQNVCRTYYKLHDPSKVLADDSVPEALCKVAAIQAEVVQLVGWLDTLWLIPGLFLGVPYGRLASIFGKRRILFICNVGYTLSLVYGFVICWFHNTFNVRLLWFTCMFDFIGGGWVVDQSLLFTYFSDGLEASKMNKYFFNLSAFRMVTRIVAMFIGAAILKTENGAWTLCIMGTLLSTLIFPALYLLPSDEPRHLRMLSMPETAHILLRNDRASMDSAANHRLSFSSRGTDDSDSDDEERVRDPSHFEIDDSNMNGQVIKSEFGIAPGDSVTKTIVKAFTTDISLSFKTAADIFIHDKLGRVCMLIFFTWNLATSVSSIFQQYASKFFSWTIADTNALWGFEMGVSLICLLTIPRLKTFVTRVLRQPASLVSELSILRASLIISAVGVVFMGISSIRPFYILALALYTIGNSALPDSIRSYATMQMEKDGEDRVKRFFIGIALVEGGGQLVGTPGFSWLYAVALTGHEGGYLTVSWPFWICGGLLLVGVTFVVWLKRMNMPTMV